jgi:hypothetical protein
MSERTIQSKNRFATDSRTQEADRVHQISYWRIDGANELLCGTAEPELGLLERGDFLLKSSRVSERLACSLNVFLLGTYIS